MSFVFKEKPVAVIKAKSYNHITGTYEQLTVPGVTTGEISGDKAVEQIHKIIWPIGGRKIIPDENMTRMRIDAIKEEA